MIEFRKDIEKIVKEELERVQSRHGKKYHSAAEAFGVLLEEVEEIYSEMCEVESGKSDFWEAVKLNHLARQRVIAEQVCRHAISLACEAVQVAAVCKRFLEGVEVE